jgi:hypothetical protein
VGIRIPCKDASRLISRMQDANLPFTERARLRLHLLFCDACTGFERQLHFLREALRNYRQ